MSTTARTDKLLNTSVRTCYWVLKPQRDTWLNEFSSMTVQIEAISGGTLFVMQGTERNNITESIIQTGEKYPPGAPL